MRSPGAGGCDFASATATWESHFGVCVVANHRGVEIAVAVYLRASEKTHFNESSLEEELKNVALTHDSERVGDQSGIADRNR